jgi:hypothetical protein
MPGAPCNPFGFTQCDYGQNACTCLRGTWGCGSCPSAEPASGTSCATLLLSCFYGDVSCICSGISPSSPSWICGGGCPAMQPQSGARCYGVPGTQCDYGATRCTCSSVWECF